MIKAILLIEEAVGSNYSELQWEAIREANKEIYAYFQRTKVILPILPQKGMTIDLCDFADGLSTEALTWLRDLNGYHDVTSITIKKDHIEVYLD